MMASLEPSLLQGIHIFTIGHSTRSFEDFLALLRESGIRALADIRRFPSSRKFPHFNRDALDHQLAHHMIDYVWFEKLGGFRHAAKSEKPLNMGLKNPGFRNYADYMITAEFRSAVQELLLVASRMRTAVMCAERFYWKCHRRILSDFLVAQGATVTHILDSGNLRPHQLTMGALIASDGSATYPLPTSK